MAEGDKELQRIQGVTKCYKGFQCVTGGDKGFQGVTRGYGGGLQEVTRSDKG